MRWHGASAAAGVVLVLALVPGVAAAYPIDVPLAVDVDPDPRVFETTLTAREATLDLTGNGPPLARVFTFDGTVPGPEIRVAVGDAVIVHFVNELPLPSSIHWHGVEVNNESDGTTVTQDPVAANGGTFTYRFRVTRPGVFWYHPHVRPTNQVFKGLYGSLIVTSAAEATLAGLGVLPALTKTLVLSDVRICAGDEASGPCAGAGAGEVPAVQPAFDCRRGGGGACNVEEGPVVLANGRAPAPVGPPLPADGVLDVPAGSAVRFQAVNAAIARYFRLVPPAGHTFYRVGGEGGLLDHVRVEGGVTGALNTLYDRGEILLAPSDRADFVLVPTGDVGDVLTILTRDYGNNASTTPLPDAPVAHVRITAAAAAGFAGIAEGDPLRTHPAVDDPIEDLEDVATLATLLDPATLPGAPRGSASPVIALESRVVSACRSAADCRGGSACTDATGAVCPAASTAATCACRADGMGPAIDGVRGRFDEPGSGSFRDVPTLASSRFARVGDVLELAVTNVTDAHHPFHHHGFSFQPLRVEDETGALLYTYDYDEFVDTVDVQDGHTLVYRIRLDDRPRLADTLRGGHGGAEGRWLFHCHIFHHAGLGMIAELVVLPSLPRIPHFQCHTVRRTHAPPATTVALADRFGARTVALRRVSRVCAPVDKNGEDPAAPSGPEHLLGYEIRRAAPRFRRVRGVEVTSQLGTHVVDVIRPVRALVPAALGVDRPPAPLDPPATPHFQCYKIRITRGRTRAEALVTDTRGTVAVAIARPRLLCLPVDKNEEGLGNEVDYLVCHDVRARPRRPHLGGPLHVHDQLGARVIEATRPRRLCVPARVRVP